jgi:hypothetical protein
LGVGVGVGLGVGVGVGGRGVGVDVAVGVCPGGVDLVEAMGVSPALCVGVLATVVGVAVEPVLGELPPQAASSMIMLNNRRLNQMFWPGKFFTMVFLLP